jgi:hypothetical protein
MSPLIFALLLPLLNPQGSIATMVALRLMALLERIVSTFPKRQTEPKAMLLRQADFLP